MRRKDPNGAWKPHPDEPRLMVPRDPDEGPEDGEFYRLLWEGTIRNYDGVTIKIAAAARGPRPQPQLPDRVGARRRAARRRPVPALGARDPRVRRGDRRAPEHHGPHRLPHVLRRSPAPLRGLRRRPLPDRRPARLQADRGGGDQAHGLPGGLGLPRLPLRPEDDDQGRRSRLVLRPPRRLLVDDRVLEPAARGRDRGLRLHRVDEGASGRRTT